MDVKVARGGSADRETGEPAISGFSAVTSETPAPAIPQSRIGPCALCYTYRKGALIDLSKIGKT